MVRRRSVNEITIDRRMDDIPHRLELDGQQALAKHPCEPEKNTSPTRRILFERVPSAVDDEGSSAWSMRLSSVMRPDVE
jgi:hypothetical protein